MFRKELRSIMHQKKYGNDKKLINELFNKSLKADIITEKILKLKKYPFRELNDWFRHFIIAVDSDIQGKESKNVWAKAHNYYNAIKTNELNKLDKLPKPKCWFEKKGDLYIKKSDFSPSGWEALLKRARNTNGNYYDFRHRALASLLKESSFNAN